VIRKGDKVLVKSTGQSHPVTSVGVFNPKHTGNRVAGGGRSRLHHCRHQGYFRRPGRRYTDAGRHTDVDMLPGFKQVKPQVYAGLFPIDSMISSPSAMRCKS
jgi:GTP-binding protein LepA